MRRNKRKRDETDFQRLVAQKLQFCADITDTVASTERACYRELERYRTQKARTQELRRFQFVLEQLTQFQLVWGAEMDVEKAQKAHLLTRLDQCLTKIANDNEPVARRAEKVSRGLPRLMKQGTSLVLARRAWLKEQSELPTKHQWVPRILWRIYDQVNEASEPNALAFEPLKSVMHQVLKTMREKNPYFYLQIVYQAPPKHRDQEWQLQASKRVVGMIATMNPLCREANARSFALRNERASHERINNGWKQLQRTLTFVKRMARHFHYLVLHLYAIALDCADPQVHAGTFSKRAEKGSWYENEVRARLKLCLDSAHSNDHLIKESYKWTPELLVYVDAWRQLRAFRDYPFGFEFRERHDAFLPQFLNDRHWRGDTRGKTSRFDVLAEIGNHLRRVHCVWRNSNLSSPSFKSITIQQIGLLERSMKYSLGEVVNLIYKMNLARWMERTKWPLEWWTSLQLRTISDVSGTDNGDKQVVKGKVSQGGSIQVRTDVNDATDRDSVDHKQLERPSSTFRPPTTVTLRQLRAPAPTLAPKVELSESNVQYNVKLLDDRKPVQLCDIYARTDEELEVLARDTKRVAEMRSAMSSLLDRVTRLQMSQSAAKSTVAHDLSAPGDNTCDAWRPACMAQQLCAMTKQAADFAETIAVYETASALVKTPSLRGTESDTVNVQDNKEVAVACEQESLENLQENVRNARTSVANMLSHYNGEQTTEWRDIIVSTSAAVADLLQTIARERAE
ncbi:hypothetical protein PsorP6_010893 [Peronosclerospora sorghi]|uniref:Uncharacterized protein n=1 Tax=Peronosclerospora sorghi TaxID=230839 RepID=A0ACC0VX03_9STRA|nr:hypothetical protein PsorP6_010893 [Peronosclerospora sorghi]